MLTEMESMAIDIYEEGKQHRYQAYRMAHLCKQAVKEWATKGKLFKPPEVIEQPPIQAVVPQETEKEAEADFYNPPPPLPVKEVEAVSDQSSIVGIDFGGDDQLDFAEQQAPEMAEASINIHLEQGVTQPLPAAEPMQLDPVPKVEEARFQ